MTALFHSAAYRIAFISALAFALATALLGATVYYAAHRAFVEQMDAGIAGASDSLLAEMNDDGVAGLREAIRQRETTGPDALGYAIFDAGAMSGGSSIPRSHHPAGIISAFAIRSKAPIRHERR